MVKYIEHLVVDTTAFIKSDNLQQIAENVYTVQEVIDEITNDRQRRKLVVLPYDLAVKDVFTENLKFVTEFSKKTGDYTSLSATDLKVIALTYQLEKEKIGVDHLKTEPTMQKIVKVTGLPSFNLHPEIDQSEQRQEHNKVISEISEDSFNKETGEINDSLSTIVNQETGETVDEDTAIAYVDQACSPKEEINCNITDDDKLAEEITNQIKNIDIKDNTVDEFIVKVSDEETESKDDSDSDGGEWITPSNLADKKRDMELGEFEEKVVEVACTTSDFAMQNVLKQIGLNVVAANGRVIKQLRTYIFRCTTCFKTTSVMTKLFCPNCGHSTLKKVGVSIDKDGNQHIHINGRKPLTAKGKKFSLPTPKGGQHFQYPILTEDQHIQKRFVTKLARKKTNAMDPDYTAGFSPFAMKDVNSKSAVLGVRVNNQDIKYWMKNFSKGKKK